jgi:hypothetical protein
MIDEKKIEEAAFDLYQNDKLDFVSSESVEGFKEGAKWAINEFLKNLWHPASEEPKHDKQITYVWGNGIAKTIILNEEADKFNRTPSQIWHNICKNYKVVSWLYIDDLSPKEGGEK